MVAGRRNQFFFLFKKFSIPRNHPNLYFRICSRRIDRIRLFLQIQSKTNSGVVPERHRAPVVNEVTSTCSSIQPRRTSSG
jgi:hypothetical protein